MKKQVIAKINNIANQLDSNGYYVEANVLTNVMKKLAFDRDFDEEGSYDEMFGEMDDDLEPNLPDPPENNSNVAVRKTVIRVGLTLCCGMHHARFMFVAMLQMVA